MNRNNNLFLFTLKWLEVVSKHQWTKTFTKYEKFYPPTLIKIFIAWLWVSVQWCLFTMAVLYVEYQEWLAGHISVDTWGISCPGIYNAAATQSNYLNLSIYSTIYIYVAGLSPSPNMYNCHGNKFNKYFFLFWLNIIIKIIICIFGIQFWLKWSTLLFESTKKKKRIIIAIK